MILTQDPEFIDHILRKNHKNYYKSEMVSRNLARFLGKGLLTSNGAYWLKQRRLIQPGFHIQRLQGLYSIMQKTIDRFLDTFPVGENVDVFPLINQFAFELVLNTLFDIKLPTESRNQLSRFVAETQEFVIRDIRQPHLRWWHHVSGEVKKNLRKSTTARRVVLDIVRDRRASKETFNDLLDMLLGARYEETGQPMEEDQVIDEILVLIIAGHETTANALSWTLFLLAGSPLELEKLRTVAKGDSLNHIISNPALNAVINESMRLYPPAWASDRLALEADAYKDWRYPGGTVIVIFYFGLHRSAHHWPDPEAFRPDRFLLKPDDKDRAKAFFPFGGGPRLCIGNNFAIAEMTLFLFAFIQRFDIGRTGVEPRMRPLITLRPDQVVLSVRRR